MERRLTKIDRYVHWAKKTKIPTDEITLRNYLGGDGANRKILQSRGVKIQYIIEGWLQKTANL